MNYKTASIAYWGGVIEEFHVDQHHFKSEQDAVEFLMRQHAFDYDSALNYLADLPQRLDTHD